MILNAIAEGLIAGLVLSVFVGPIFFTMLQLGVEHGFKAAAALALGQWIGDIIYICLAFWGAIWVEEIIQDPDKQALFLWYSGTFGGCLLILFGLGLLFTKAVSTEVSDKVDLDLTAHFVNDSDIPSKDTNQKDPKVSNIAYFAYTTQGFLINTINPTPLLFWMGLMAFAINRNYHGGATFALYFTVMSVVIITDVLKIYLAKHIRNKLKAQHFLYVRRLAGLVLAGFGLFLLLKFGFKVL